MTTRNDLAAAVERLRRVKSGENPINVYGTRERPQGFASYAAWTPWNWRERANALMQSDQEDLADAYIDLGEQETDDTYRLEGGKKFRVATFIREVQG